MDAQPEAMEHSFLHVSPTIDAEVVKSPETIPPRRTSATKSDLSLSSEAISTKPSLDADQPTPPDRLRMKKPRLIGPARPSPNNMPKDKEKGSARDKAREVFISNYIVYSSAPNTSHIGTVVYLM